jgi:hypothetical protein
MDEEKATKILGTSIVKSDQNFKNNELKSSSDMGYISWDNRYDYVTIDGELNAEKLEALAWWIRNKKRKEK